MKIFAFIFALLVCSLSVSAYSLERNCYAAAQTCENMPAENDDNCPSDCSPFHQCGSCGGFTIPVISQNNAAILQSNSLKIFYTQPHYSAFCGDIWQPPKQLIINN
jgi:hypothetical protein